MDRCTQALVFAAARGDRYRAGRTVRALKAAGFPAADLCELSLSEVARHLADSLHPVWLVRAGAWPCAPAGLAFPSPSATGRPLCALGAVRAEPGRPDGEADRWRALQTASGGDFSLLPDLGKRLPTPASVYLDAAAAAAVARRLRAGETLPQALCSEAARGACRVVRHAPLDVYHDHALRVVQVVTTLQRGGAERVALDLTQRLGKWGVRPLLVTLGRPTRLAFPVPPGTVDLSSLTGGREARLAAVCQAAITFAADLVHAHLLHGDDLGWLSAAGLPVTATVHNARPGWPPGLDTLRPTDAHLLIACSQAVERDLRSAAIPVPVRTAWNGIDFAPFERTPSLAARAAEARRRLGLGAGDFVMLALANPRPQKRLERLPGILAATRTELARRGIGREARLVLAGEPARGSEPAARAVAMVQAEAARLGVESHVRLIGPADDVAALLAAADALVSASAYEGLSLAHLEALASGLPVVATDAGGTAEVARDNPAVFLLPADSLPEQFAEVLARLAISSISGGREAAAVHFTRERMAEQYTRLYPRAIEAARGPRCGDGLLLVTNNFSTGGAQSSARRLLLGLATQGVRVRAAVLQEHPDQPTPGRQALVAAGIEVRALPPAGETDPAEAVAQLLEDIDNDRPAAVVFWNAIAAHKVLLADALLDVPLYDVSPGEMHFEALERYFARPRPGLPYVSPRDYGARLAGLIVKYHGEVSRAAALGAPVHVIPNGVPLAPLGPSRCSRHAAAERSASAARPPEGPLVIGTAARLSPQKRLEDLLAAVRLAHERLPPYVLRIAGGAERGTHEYAAQLRRLAEGLPVEWLGGMDDVQPFLSGLEIFVMISEPAGCPNASLEAMAAGLPVIATDVGGAAEQIVDGTTGRLVPRGDTEAFAEALVELARDPVRRRAWGQAGRARCEALFDVRRMVADYRRVCLSGK